MIYLVADGVENPGNRARIADAAALLSATLVTASPPGARLVAVENSPGARDIYGRKPAREDLTLAVGNERRGVSRRLLANADEAVVIPTLSRSVDTLNVAAAAAVATFYMMRGSGPQARVAKPNARRPTLLLVGNGDWVEVGASIRSAAAFGFQELLLADHDWFDGLASARREARAAARRHKNPVRVRRADLASVAERFEEIIVVAPNSAGPPLPRARLARGARQLIVVGEVANLARATTASLGLTGAQAPLRITASIALAEVSRQVGLPKRAPAAPDRRRPPRYDRILGVAAAGDLVELSADELLES